MTSYYVKQETFDTIVLLLENAASHCTDASIALQLSQQALDMRAIIDKPQHTLEKIPQNTETLLQVAAIIAVRDYKNTVNDIVTGRFSAASPNRSGTPKCGTVVYPEYVPAVFPTMLRKMWSGGEVQKWLDENKCMMEKTE